MGTVQSLVRKYMRIQANPNFKHCSKVCLKFNHYFNVNYGTGTCHMHFIRYGTCCNVGSRFVTVPSCHLSRFFTCTVKLRSPYCHCSFSVLLYNTAVTNIPIFTQRKPATYQEWSPVPDSIWTGGRCCRRPCWRGWRCQSRWPWPGRDGGPDPPAWCSPDEVGMDETQLLQLQQRRQHLATTTPH